MFHKFNPEAGIQDEIEYLTEQLRRVEEWQESTDFMFDGNKLSEAALNAAAPFIADIERQIESLRGQLAVAA